MINTSSEIPEDAESYGTVVFCSNEIIGGGELISVMGQFPIQIKKGTPPKVWLRRLSDVKNPNLVAIVEATVSKASNVGVLSAFGGVLIVVNGEKVLSVIEREVDKIEIDFIDLRPLGLKIYGDSEKLNAGGMQLSGNVFSGVGVAFALG